MITGMMSDAQIGMGSAMLHSIDMERDAESYQTCEVAVYSISMN
jgi:hypothetical protein